MVSQLTGAVVRALIVIIVMATPALLIPGITQEGAQVVTLVGLVLAVFVGMEYATTYPGLIEFRDAPPFNRVRILTLFVTLFLLSLIAQAAPGHSSLALVVNALGLSIANVLDFPFSPVRLIADHLPVGITAFETSQVKGMAGLALLISVLAMAVFTLLIRMHQWPNRGSAFNVWVNLPTFDPTTGGDVVQRLRRDARVNLVLGISTPFIVPVVGAVAANHMEVVLLASPHAMVWGLTLWMFIPLSLFMRGLAMGRIADMISQRRARLVANLAADAPASPAF